MKSKLLILTAAIILCLPCMQAQKNGIEWIAGPMEPFSIDKVKTTKRLTTLDMTFHGNIFYITASPRLIGQNGAVHPLVKIKGARKGKNTTKHGVAKFSLSFSPLAPEDSIFDFVQGACRDDYGCFWGVHDKGTTIDVSAPTSRCDTSLVFSQKDKFNTCLIGHIQNKKTGIAVMTQIDLDHDRMNKRDDTVRIDESGYFVFDTKIHGPEFTYIYIPDELVWIPVFLNPNDTLLCNINIPSKGVHECDYKSINGYNTCKNLMISRPTWRDFTHRRLRLSEENADMAQVFENLKKEIDSLSGYLASKYDMSPFEYELLHIFLLEELEYEKVASFRSKQECRTYALPEEIKTSPVRFSCYSSPYLFHVLKRCDKEGWLLPERENLK